MNAVFHRVLFSQTYDRAMPMILDNLHETGDIEDDPNIDLETYLALERADVLRCGIAVDHDGVLVGYQVMMVRRGIQHRNTLCAIQDALYVDPPHRYTPLPYRFIRWMDDILKEEGVVVVYRDSKGYDGVGYGRFYELIETRYRRRL